MKRNEESKQKIIEKENSKENSSQETKIEKRNIGNGESNQKLKPVTWVDSFKKFNFWSLVWGVSGVVAVFVTLITLIKLRKSRQVENKKENSKKR